MSALDEDKLAQKRKAVLGGGDGAGKKSMGNFAVMVLALAVTVVAGYFFLGRGPEVSTATAAPASAPSQSGAAEVSYSLSDFSDGNVKFYEHMTAEGVKIRYFLVKAPDGTVRSAFDACDSCWPAGKGYKQDGKEVICNNCRMRFPMEKVGVVKGGCNPSPLAAKTDSGRITIKISDLEAGKTYFDLKNK
jgi:uncharacterized membrane protein